MRLPIITTQVSPVARNFSASSFFGTDVEIELRRGADPDQLGEGERERGDGEGDVRRAFPSIPTR